jgi:ABC-type Mn2+/Zn2+ transport system permease subunit
MDIHKLKQGWIRLGFAGFATCATLDLIVLLMSDAYRNIMGRTHGISDVTVMCRIVLDVAMMVLYWMAYRKIREHGISRLVAITHGVSYGLLGLLMCFPLGGFFLAPFTPIGVLYFGSLMWTPVEFIGSLVVGGAFVAFNLFLAWAGLKLKSDLPAR